MQRLLALLCLVLSCAVGMPAAKGKTDHLGFVVPKGWKFANSREVPDQYQMMEFVREGDDLKNWKELLTIQNFPKSRAFGSPQKAYDNLKAQTEKDCPGATQWNVIAQDANSILYEWHSQSCRDWPEQHEVARILIGKYNAFILHYAAKVHELAADTRAEWIKFFGEASITTDK